MEENIIEIDTVSTNDISQTETVESTVETLQVNVETQDYTELLEQINTSLTENNNYLRDIISLNSIEEETVSENTISENAIFNTQLTEYSITDTLLLLLFLLFVFFGFAFLFVEKDR